MFFNYMDKLYTLDPRYIEFRNNDYAKLVFHSDLINYLIQKNNYKSYLEIGLDDPFMNYYFVNIDNKECVDPYEFNDNEYKDCRYELSKNDIQEIIDTMLTYKMTSDDFFAQNTKTYDIIFIDGLHTEEQVAKDIINSLKILNPGGILIVHDCLPDNKDMQDPNRHVDLWTGDVWKAIPGLSEQNIDYKIIDMDQVGCGIIPYHNNPENIKYMEKSTLDYDTVFTNKTVRDSIMHVISKEQFLQEY